MTFYKQDKGHAKPREYILGGRVEILRREGFCPVCGHPSGDCTGDEHAGINSTITQEAPDSGDKTHYVDRDVYGDKQVGTGHWKRAVIVPAGTWITAQPAKKLGLA